MHRKRLWTDLDSLGEAEVRLRIARRVYEQHLPLVEEWLRRKDHDRSTEAAQRSEASISEQIDIARSAKDAAWAAADAARAANKRATIALVVATIAAIASIISVLSQIPWGR